MVSITLITEIVGVHSAAVHSALQASSDNFSRQGVWKNDANC